MIIKKICNKISKYNREDLTPYLITGLITGLIAILITSLINSLIICLIVGLTLSLITILITSLIDSLITSLINSLIICLGFFIGFFSSFGIASLFVNYPSYMPIWLVLIVGIIVLEVFFWLDSDKLPERMNKLLFTSLKKGEALLETIAVFGYLNLARLSIEKLKLNWEIVLKWIGYIGVGIVALAIIIEILYLYIKMNIIKYNK